MRGAFNYPLARHNELSAAKSSNGWRTCSRGHKFRGTGPCPVCWPNKKIQPKKERVAIR
jgi:hypothetical protein